MVTYPQGVHGIFSTNQIAPRDIGNTILCRNQSGEVIPPRAAIELDGTFTGGARDAIKPSDNSLDSNLIAFNGEQVVPIGENFFAYVNYESLGTIKDGDSPAIGDDIGTETALWTLTTSQTGLKARGLTSGGYVYVVPFSGGGCVVRDLSGVGVGAQQVGNRFGIDDTSANISFDPFTFKAGTVTALGAISTYNGSFDFVGSYGRVGYWTYTLTLLTDDGDKTDSVTHSCSLGPSPFGTGTYNVGVRSGNNTGSVSPLTDSTSLSFNYTLSKTTTISGARARLQVIPIYQLNGGSAFGWSFQATTTVFKQD